MPENRRRILLVDDDPLVVRGLTRILAGSYDVIGVNNPSTALATLGEQAVDVVISDVIMPGSNARQFYRDLQAAWPLAARRTLFLTGLLDSEEARRMTAQGGRLLQKPVETQKLLDVVAALLRD